MNTARKFKHVPGMVKFHARGIGLHWKMPNTVSRHLTEVVWLMSYI